MYHSDVELLFPLHVTACLADLRGEEWHALVQRVAVENAQLADQMAFVLMMVRLNGCISCSSDSFRAMRGCQKCSQNTIRRFKDSDDDLIQLFQQACQETERYLGKRFSGLKQRTRKTKEVP